MSMDSCNPNYTTFFFSKWNIFFSIIRNKKNLIGLFFSGLLIFINWAVWIYAVATDRIIDASFGYFIMPILSVFLGYIFFKERLNTKRIFSIALVILLIIILLFFSMKYLPWVSIIVATITTHGKDFMLKNNNIMIDSITN